MTVIEEAAFSAARETPRPRVPGRQWLLHLVALAALVLGTMWFVGPGVFTIDENAYRSQSDHLAETGEWAVPRVEVPEGVPLDFAPLALSEVRGDVWFPYVRHPVYPVSITVADRIAPGRGAIVLSMVGLLAVALAAGWMADRLVGVDGRLGFWLTASASPFLVHSQIGWAHLPAAAALLAAIALIHTDDDVSPLRALGASIAIATAVLLRTEGLFAAVALFGAVAIAPRARGPKMRWLATISVASAVAFATDRLLFRWITGSASLAPTGGGGSDDSVVVERLQASIALFLDVGGESPQHVARLLSAVLFIVAAVLVRRKRGLDLVAAVVGLSLVLGLFGALEGDPYPGLLAAWPLLGPALVLAVDRQRHLLNLVSLGGMWALLIAVMPPDGGGLGWGGRLGLVSLAVAAPVVAEVVSRSVATEDRGPKAVIAAALAMSVTVSAVGIGTIAAAHDTSIDVGSQVSGVLEGFVGTDAVLISTDRRLGRMAPDVASRLPLHSLPDDEPLAGFLAAVGQRSEVETIVHIDLFDHDEPRIPEGWIASAPELDGVVRTMLIERSAS